MEDEVIEELKSDLRKVTKKIMAISNAAESGVIDNFGIQSQLHIQVNSIMSIITNLNEDVTTRKIELPDSGGET